MKAGIDDTTRALLATRFKRLSDEAGGDPLSEAYRVRAFGISVLTFMGNEETLRTIQSASANDQDIVVALFGDLWTTEEGDRH